MAAPAKALANTDGFQYAIKWKTETIGLIKDCDPSAIKEKMTEQKIGELDNVVVDRHHRGGVDGAIKMVLHEVKADRIRQLMPWAASTGSFSVSATSPAYSEYANAGLLTIHPIGAANTNDDMNFIKAFPNVTLPKNAGDNYRELTVEWNVYPDQAALVADPPVITYGYVGAPPA